MKSTTLQRFRPRFDRGLRLLAMLTLMVVAILSFLTWRRYEAAITSSERSREVLEASGSLLTSVKDAEAAMRMFVLTGNEKDLMAYQAVLGSLPARQAKLNSVAVLPHQSGLAAKINQLADERVAFLATGAQIRQQSGIEGATLYIQTSGGQAKMAELMAAGAQLFSDEYDEQARMAKIAESRAFDTFLVASLGCALAFVILLLLQRAVDSAIAQRNGAIADLADTSQRWEITLSSIGDGVVATDGEGRVTFLNPVAEKLTGWAHADAVGRPADDVFRIADEESGAPVPSPLARVLESGRIEGLPTATVLLPKQGEPIAIADSGSPIRTGDGKTVGAVLVFRDIRATREAQRQIEKWHRLFRAGGFGMALIDSETDTLLDLNPAFAAMHGYEERELLGKNLSLLAANDEPHLRTLQESERVTFESRHLHKSGQTFPVLTDMTTFRDASGKATERAAYFSDISARILAERISLHSQERFKTAVEVVGDIIWTNNAEGKMEGEQYPWSQFTGQTLQEYQGYGWSAALHPDDRDRTVDAWKLAVEEKRKFVIEHCLRRHDGVYRMFAVRALPLFDDLGNIREWVGVHADITDERLSREQLAESESRFRGLATSLPQVIWSTQPDGQFEYTNQAWQEYLNVDTANHDKVWEQILHADDAATILPKWREATGAGKPFEFQARLRRAADGSFRCFLCRSVPLFDATGQVIRWFGSCTDIEEQSERTNALKASNEALRRSNTDLEQFAYAASHDLQEPLRMVALYTQLLGEEYSQQLDDEARYYIDQAKKGALRMETLLHALLSYSLVTTSSASLDSRADANASVRDAMENLESLIARSGAAIHFEDLPTVHVPAVRLTQLFQNLIGNSLKYRREGISPEVTISAVRQGAERWRFSVKDNGIGIAPEFLNHVFGIFKRMHGHEYEGTGIGLAICQRIVENAGGRIWAESELGQGTTFCFTLPESSRSAA